MLITEMPADTPTTNALASIPDDLLGPHPATINMSGKDLLVMDTPPEMGAFVKMEITMLCKKDGRTLLPDGGIGHYRVMSFVAAKVTAEPYLPEAEPSADTAPGRSAGGGESMLFPDCVIPGCPNPVTAVGDACGDCVAAFGPMLRPGPRLTADEIAERDRGVRAAYALQLEAVA